MAQMAWGLTTGQIISETGLGVVARMPSREMRDDGRYGLCVQCTVCAHPVIHRAASAWMSLGRRPWCRGALRRWSGTAMPW